MKPFHLNAAAGIVLSALAFGVQAHSALEKAAPADGAVLERSPPAIELQFKDPVRLTSVVVVAAQKPARKLSFSPGASAAKFAIAEPNLAAGRNEIQWKALARDGHVVSGSLIYNVKPAAAQAL
jgi:copper resistance protein C